MDTLVLFKEKREREKEEERKKANNLKIKTKRTDLKTEFNTSQPLSLTNK